MEHRTLTPTAHALAFVGRGAALDVVPFLLRRLVTRPGLIALDSVGGVPRKWSILGFDPYLDFDAPGAAPESLDALDALLALASLATAPGAAEGPDLGPFAGGFLGALSYELGVRGEPLRLPRPAWPQPLIAGGLYRDWILLEHGPAGTLERATLYVCEDSSDGSAAKERAAERVRSVLDLIDPLASADTPMDLESMDGHAEGPGERTISRERHCERVVGAREYIARGEVYQANISHRMVSTAPVDALALYLRLRATNPAPYMGFLRFRAGETACALLSSSPELLLELHTEASGRRIARTRPIKGTVARGATVEEDERNRASLLQSDKDLAELAMIVDLERNDLGRIAEPGGVMVGAFPELESYAAVHHLVADVSARVSAGVSAIDVVASLFPGGSITGAPKLRSMEVIAELEEEGRGFFTGSMGFVDLRGEAALSILIRTMVHREGPDGAEVSFHVGGGITWNSDPGHEDDETLWKAAGMLRALTSGFMH